MHIFPSIDFVQSPIRRRLSANVIDECSAHGLRYQMMHETPRGLHETICLDVLQSSNTRLQPEGSTYVQRTIHTLRNALPWCLVMLWCAFIFSMSAENGGTSGGMSSSVAQVLIGWLVPDYHTLSAAQQTIALDQCQLVVRKCAHFTEYAILGTLFLNALLRMMTRTSETSSPFRQDNLQTSTPPRRQHTLAHRAFISWILATAYATTDEFHQLFVVGRSSQVGDVLIDSAGALAGILIATTVFRRRNRTGFGGASSQRGTDQDETSPS
jgi:VanZ family protein